MYKTTMKELLDSMRRHKKHIVEVALKYGDFERFYPTITALSNLIDMIENEIEE